MKSVANALRVLEYLAEREEAGVSEVSQELRIATSTAHRLLGALGAAGFVLQDGGRQKYRLSIKVFQLGARVANRHGLRQVAMPFMERLAAATGETANLGILHGTEVVYLEKVLNDDSMRLELQVGRGVPAHCTALGKAILAYQNPPLLDQLAGQIEFKPRTKNTITTMRALQRELLRVRRSGFALDREENFEGIRCVAAPVFDLNGVAIAAISLAGPASRLGDRHLLSLAREVVATAMRVSSGLGYEPERQRKTRLTGTSVGVTHIRNGDAVPTPRPTRRKKGAGNGVSAKGG
jgi:DNA-binding IclR family transcriptional regulator